MPDTLLRLVHELKETASFLDDARLSDLVATAEEHSTAPHLRLLIVGSGGSGRFSVANTVLGQPDLLPVSPIPKIPMPVIVRHGDSPAVEAVDAQGTRQALTPDRLRSILCEPNTAGYGLVEVRTNSELLRTCELRIESLEAKHSPGSWQEILAGTDYVLVVLNANALLSEQEKHFIRTDLHGGIGLQRVAIIVNQLDLIPEDERDSIIELVRTFLGPFESAPPVIELSAAECRRSLKSGRPSDAMGYVTLMSLIDQDLVAQHRTLRAAALRQAVDTCLTALDAVAHRRQALLAMSEAEVHDLKDTLDSRQEWLQARIERSRHRVQAFVNTLIKEQLLREIDAFGRVVQQRLLDEVMAIDDTITIKRHLPGYLESIWAGFLDRQETLVRSRLFEEAQKLGAIVEDDLSELLDTKAGAVRGDAQGIQSSSVNVSAYVMPKRGAHRANAAVKGLQLMGLVLLIWNIPFGLLNLGAGHLVRTFFKGDIDIAEKTAIAESAVAANLELERRVKRQIQERFAELTRELADEVEKLYTQGIQRIQEFLAESLNRHAASSDRQADVERIIRKTVPDLRRTLDALS
jgi:hypothetical protein